MDIHNTFLPHTDPDASLAFYRDVLGFEVRLDVGQGAMRWITVAPQGAATSIVLYPPAADPGVTEDEQRTITEMMAKGTFATIVLSTPTLDADFDRIAAAGARWSRSPPTSRTACGTRRSGTRRATRCA